MRMRYLPALFLVMIGAPQSFAAPRAFPGAEGFGSGTRGAYQLYEQTGDPEDLPRILKVTNLNNGGEGSFRAAVTAAGPRIVVFETGGIITLSSDVVISNPYLTIAGQTAPGDGIVLRGATLRFQSTASLHVHDVVARGLRIRPTAITSIGSSAADNRDAFMIGAHYAPPHPNEPYNIVIDRFSTSWSTDESCSIYYGGSNITISNSIFYKPVTAPRPAHHYGPLIAQGADSVSFHHNYTAHAVYRTPRLGGANDIDLPAATNIEIVNNVVYNSRNWYSSNMEESHGYDDGPQPTLAVYIGEYHKQGPDADGAPDRYYIGPEVNTPLDPASLVYMSGNLSPRRQSQHDPNVLFCGPSSSCRLGLLRTPDTDPPGASPFSVSGVSIRDAADNYKWIGGMAGEIPNIGAYPRDIVDQIAFEELYSGTRFMGTLGEYGPGPTDAATTSNWRQNRSMFPAYDPGVAPEDADGDGMPDDWEEARGLDPEMPADAHADRDHDGYTNIEEYINGLFDQSSSGRLAFPGAEGFGAKTLGAYQKHAETHDPADLPKIIKVTNLEDNGPGSFREALFTEGPRIIVFTTGGTIQLQSKIYLKGPQYSYMTIAGQTAPGDGIMIKGGRVELNWLSDVIIRGLRIRPGNGEVGSVPRDDRVPLALRGDENDPEKKIENIIVDHCSLSWSTDKIVAIYAKAERISVTNTIMSEPYANCTHCNGDEHNFGIFVGAGGEHITIAKNVIAHSSYRNPRFGGTQTWIPQLSGSTKCESINNIVYNARQWGGTSIGNNPYNANLQQQQIVLYGDYHKAGVNSGAPEKYTPEAVEEIDEISQIYVFGNLSPRRTSDTMDQWAYFAPSAIKDAVKFNDGWPFNASPTTITSATDAYDYLVIENGGMDGTIPRAGAFPRDAVDGRIISEIQSGDAFLGTAGSWISADDTVNSLKWPTYAEGSPWGDSDDDGMADTWEMDQYGSLQQGPHDDYDGNGYTNIEDYINSFLITNGTTAQPPRRDAGAFPLPPDGGGSHDEEKTPRERTASSSGCSCSLTADGTFTKEFISALLLGLFALIRRRGT